MLIGLILVLVAAYLFFAVAGKAAGSTRAVGGLVRDAAALAKQHNAKGSWERDKIVFTVVVVFLVLMAVARLLGT